MSKKFSWKQRSPFQALFHAILRGEVRGDAMGVVGLGMGSTKKQGRGKNRPAILQKFQGAGKIFQYLFLALLFTAMMIGVGYLGRALGMNGMPPQILFLSVILSILLFTLMGGIYSTVSYLYFVKDIPFYLALPLKAEQISSAKLLHFMGFSILGNLLFLPLPLAGLAAQNAKPTAYLVMILAYLAAASAIDFFFTVLTIVLMRFSKLARNKDRFVKIFSGIIIVVALAGGVGVQFLANGNAAATGNALNSVLSGGPLRIFMSLICLPLLFTSWTFSSQTGLVVGGLLAMLAALVLYVAAFYFSSKAWYLSSVMRIQEGGGDKPRQKLSRSDFQKGLASRRSVAFLSFYERAKIKRNPVFFTQIFMSNLLLPLYFVAILGAVAFIQIRKQGMNLAAALEQLRGFTAAINFQSPPLAYIAFGLLALLTFNSSSGHAYKIAVSTDGEDFFFLKQLPLKIRDSLLAKAVYLHKLNLLPNTLLICALIYLSGMPLSAAVFLLGIYLLGMLSSLTTFLGLGAIYPALHWDNETQLVKGGSNFFWVYLEMLIGALLQAPAVLALLGAVIWHLYPLPVAYGLAIGLQLLIFILTQLFTFVYAAGKLSKRE